MAAQMYAKASKFQQSHRGSRLPALASQEPRCLAYGKKVPSRSGILDGTELVKVAQAETNAAMQNPGGAVLVELRHLSRLITWKTCRQGSWRTDQLEPQPGSGTASSLGRTPSAKMYLL